MTEEDVEKELENMAEMYQTDVENIKKMLGGNADMVKEDVKIRKAIEFLVEHAKSA